MFVNAYADIPVPHLFQWEPDYDRPITVWNVFRGGEVDPPLESKGV